MVKASVKSGAYAPLDRQWRATCRFLLGEDIGPLSDYADWLYEGNGPRFEVKSCISGQPVVFPHQFFPESARFASFEEVDLDQKFPPLSINEIKDMDSLLSAISERAIYCGNMVMGNSSAVEESTVITDSHFILHSERFAFSKYLAYSTRGNYNENLFGCWGVGPTSFCIKSRALTSCTRCFNVLKADYSSDLFFSHGLLNCSDCIFSFHLKNRRNCVGNLALPREKYLELKGKLLSETRERLRKEKRLDFIVDMFVKIKPDYSLLKHVSGGQGKAKAAPKTESSRIERAFAETCNILLGKPIGRLDDFSEWLSQGKPLLCASGKSCVSGQSIILSEFARADEYPKGRLVSDTEADEFGSLLTVEENELDSISLSSAGKIISKIAYFCPIWLVGKVADCTDSPNVIDSSGCHHGWLFMQSKDCAYCSISRNNESSFGCREAVHSSFSLNCHFSVKLSRCFECDSCNSCSGCYFCHNCENVHDSMFCFNTKNKKYAIGNVEVGREKFMSAKKILLDWINAHLAKSRSLPLDIYSISAYRKEKGK
jgi:hypothetical protein